MKRCPKCKEEKSLDLFHKSKSLKDGLSCWCKECNRKAGNDGYKNNPKIRERILKRTRENYYKNFKRHQAQKKVYYKTKVISVFNRLGNECSLCGQRDKRLLQIDHVHGGGNKHRKSLGRASWTFYRDVLKSVENEEGKFRLLCANCNWLEGIKNGHRKSVWSEDY